MFQGSAEAANILRAARLLVVFETPGPQSDGPAPLDPSSLSRDPLVTSSFEALDAAAKEAAKKSAEAEIKAGRRTQTRVREVAGSGLLSWGGETVQLNLLALPALVIFKPQLACIRGIDLCGGKGGLQVDEVDMILDLSVGLHKLEKKFQLQSLGPGLFRTCWVCLFVKT